MELGLQLSWDVCFEPDPFALSTAYSFPDSVVDLALDSSSSDSFDFCNQSAETLCLGPPRDGARSSLSSTPCEDGFRDFYDDGVAPSDPDLCPKPVGLTSTASVPTNSSPHPFHMERETLGGVSRSLQQRDALSRTSTPAVTRDQTHDRKVRGKRSPTYSRRNSTEVNPKAKAAHSVVERRYRDKLNDKMMQLHLTLAASQWRAPTYGESTLPDDLSLGKIGKAGIMTNAINYVNQAELQLRQMSNEIEELRSRVLRLETLLPHDSDSLRSHLLAAF